MVFDFCQTFVDCALQHLGVRQTCPIVPAASGLPATMIGVLSVAITTQSNKQRHAAGRGRVVPRTTTIQTTSNAAWLGQPVYASTRARPFRHRVPVEQTYCTYCTVLYCTALQVE